MERRIYPAIFHRENDGRYSVFLPDFDMASTFGDNFIDAYNMARDLIATWVESKEEHGLELPVPTQIVDIHTKGKDKVINVEEGLYEPL